VAQRGQLQSHQNRQYQHRSFCHCSMYRVREKPHITYTI
jgi:hypothetical protein